MPTPNYILTSEVHIRRDRDSITLPCGAFVRPIELCYVPQHILEAEGNKYFSPTLEVFCYTRIGIVPIHKSYLREV